MSEGRVYTVIMPRQAVTVAKDLIQIAPAANKPVKVLRAMVSQDSKTVEDQKPVDIARCTTDGTGGTGVTPMKHNPGDPASSAVCAYLNGVDAAGTEEQFYLRGDNFLNGWDYDPTEEELVTIITSDVVVVRLVIDPSESQTMSCVVTFREMG